MKIRRFFAPDMRQAIRLVREEQGPDAVILSSRRVEDGIELVTAVDYDESAFSELPQGDRASPSSGNASAAGPGPEAGDLPAPDDDAPEMLEPVTDDLAGFRRQPSTPTETERPERERARLPDYTLAAMQREIEHLRSMLEDQLDRLAWNDLRQREPGRARLVRRLQRLGLDEALAAAIAGEVTDPDLGDTSWRMALEVLAERIPLVPETRLDGDGIIALVGPSGVGKTTTVAKLAARDVQRYGAQSVALVTTDACRIGAYRQLQTFGQILGVPVYLAQTAGELGEILNRLGEKRRIFVDTAGMSQRDLRLAEEMSGLAALPSLRTLLVVAANTQQAVLEETFGAFGGLPLEGVVVTKLDEAVSLGPMLSALCAADLPLMFVSDGQQVPEDLKPAQGQRLVTRAVSLVSETREERAPEPVYRRASDNRGLDSHVSA